jgi:3-phenylpropionate/trans-cinnamate dioxygenase ferredoxin component
MMPDATFETLLDQLDQLVAMFEQHPDETVQNQVTALLTAIDMIHREGLTRLLTTLRESRGEDIVDELRHDRVVETLLGLYGLVELDLPEEPALVPSASPTVEQILLQYGERARWTAVADLEEIPEGTMLGVSVDEVRALLVNSGGEIYAVRNACAGTDLPLDMGQLRGHQIICSWHGCEYDARSGQRTDGVTGRLQVYPVALRGSSVELAMQQPLPPPPAAVDAAAAAGREGGCGSGQCGCS